MYKDLDEQKLAMYCSRGDRMAENELYRRYAVRLNMLCKRYVVDDDEAKDLMLETLIKALEKIGTYEYRGNGSLYSWISRIAINNALNRIRRNRGRIVSLEDLWMNDNIPEPVEDEVASIPEEKILEWISRLPDLRRSVFNMYCIDGYSHQEISQMLGISVTGSTSALAKARKQLKKEIRRYINGQDK